MAKDPKLSFVVVVVLSLFRLLFVCFVLLVNKLIKKVVTDEGKKGM